MPDAPEYPVPNRLRETAVGERPQERLEKLGAAALSDTELLAMLLRSGTRGHDVLTLASRLMAGAGSLAGLIAWREKDFRKLKGIGRVKALQLLTVMEIARRILDQKSGDDPPLNRADFVADYLAPLAVGLEVEKFWVLCLNRKNRLLRRVEITSGTATAHLHAAVMEAHHSRIPLLVLTAESSVAHGTCAIVGRALEFFEASPRRADVDIDALYDGAPACTLRVGA